MEAGEQGTWKGIGMGLKTINTSLFGHPLGQSIYSRRSSTTTTTWYISESRGGFPEGGLGHMWLVQTGALPFPPFLI